VDRVPAVLAKSKLVGVGRGCRRSQSGYRYCRLVSPWPGGAVRPHGRCHPETSEVADDSHPTAGLPARGRMADHRRAAAGRVLGRWLGQQMAEPRGSSVRHHPGGWIPPDDSRASPSSASHARFAARPGYGPSLVRYVHVVGSSLLAGLFRLGLSMPTGSCRRSLWSTLVVKPPTNRRSAVAVRGPGVRRRRRGPKGLRAARGAQTMPVPGLTAARARQKVRRAGASTTSRAADLRSTDGHAPARLRALETVEKVLTGSH
jgi:hypothetical protein